VQLTAAPLAAKGSSLVPASSGLTGAAVVLPALPLEPVLLLPATFATAGVVCFALQLAA